MRRILRNKGFTAAEIIIVILLAAIIAAIGIPSLTEHIHRSELRSCTDTAERISADIERIIVTDVFIDTDELDEAVSASLSRYSLTEPTISRVNGIVSAAIKSHSGDSFVICWEVDILSSRVLLDISCKEHETDIKRSVRADFFEL